MTQQEYENKKRECWEEFKRTNLDGEVQWQPVSRYDVFCTAFDRAYALGKQFGNPEQVDIEKAAEKFADEIRIPTSIPGVMIPLLRDIAKSSYLQGAQDFLGKQFGNSEQLNAEGEEMLYADKSKVQKKSLLDKRKSKKAHLAEQFSITKLRLKLNCSILFTAPSACRMKSRKLLSQKIKSIYRKKL